MDIVVRPITPDEVEPWVRAKALGFHRSPPPTDTAIQRDDLDLDRTLGAFDGDRIVGTFRSMPRRLTLPGGADTDAPVVDAITNVTVQGTHRRRGLLRRMMALDLAAAVERGEPAAILIAAEYPIYGRYGFGPAADRASLVVDAATARLRPEVADRLPPLRGELVDPAAARAEVPALYDAYRRDQPGAIDRDARWWDQCFGIVERPGHEPPRRLHLLARDPGGRPVGYLLHRVDETWQGMRTTSTLHVEELVGADTGATAWLWRYCLDLDLIQTVRAHDRHPTDTLPWLLTDPRAATAVDVGDLLWVRPLDVPRLLSARRYPVPGRVVLAVEDPDGFVGGRYTLEIDTDGVGHCERATASAPATDLTTTAAGLGSLLLGGAQPRNLAAVGLITPRHPRTLDRVAALFGSATAPWCNTWF